MNNYLLQNASSFEINKKYLQIIHTKVTLREFLNMCSKNRSLMITKDKIQMSRCFFIENMSGSRIKFKINDLMFVGHKLQHPSDPSVQFDFILRDGLMIEGNSIYVENNLSSKKFIRKSHLDETYVFMNLRYFY